MNTRTVLTLGLSALVLGGTTVGCTGARGVGMAASKAGDATAKFAGANADKAAKALARGDAAGAVPFAEAAVTGAPQDAGYRVLLGRTYLKAGRFASARAAYADALSLLPAEGGETGRAALNLALAETATGDWAAARATLDKHAAVIPTADRGLALALAGDPASAVQLLMASAREPGANATTRQNLALALALGGQWQMAKSVAAADMSPADVDKRMTDWASFASPRGASDQVATLLGVQPAADPGQPIALALSAPASPVALAESQVVETVPVDTAELSPEALPPVATVAVPASVEPRVAAIRTVQDVPVAVIRAERTSAKVALRPAAKPVAARPAAPLAVAAPLAKGNWYVQLGAYDSAGVARDAWGRAQRRFAGFQGQTPAGMSFASKAGSFYRLSVGGYARPDAMRLCARFRAAGGTCFVRTGAGDQVAQWVKSARVQVASR